MPKFVDHEKQKILLAEAVWRIIRREGIEKASVRNIAEEAGISTGSMRHYFSTQSELFAFAMELVATRVKERMERFAFSGNPVEDMRKLLLELLPMDEERRAETEVWLAFNIKALSDPNLKKLSTRVYQEMKQGMSLMVDTLIQYDLAVSEIDRDSEIENLYGLIDGLALHAIIRTDDLPPETMEEAVSQYIGRLCK
ncbi:TetR/AcrR family transcriptional regulator [Peribacillus deserti]|uniref:TetR family transcriptional regulator n=1 Tax=Peribacillus deserti TaxID=673318 RepID=A0A2N5MB88_9BACI|nr:TetR/AcrR family transcriptional regulator [Peribacillus deserti]PLT31629.1 TetR family transcriptional regulator [Peribacillus deserti]